MANRCAARSCSCTAPGTARGAGSRWSRCSTRPAVPVGRGRPAVGVVTRRDAARRRRLRARRARRDRRRRRARRALLRRRGRSARRACTRASRTSCTSPRSRSRWGSRRRRTRSTGGDGRSELDAAIRVRRRRAHDRSRAARSPRSSTTARRRSRAAAVERLRPQSLAALGGKVTAAAWREKPATYVVCTDDRALPVALQRSNAARVGNSIDWPTSHSPFLSRPELVADLLIELSSR